MAITKADQIKTMLTLGVNQGLATRTKIADAMMKSGEDAEYQLRWLEGSYKDVMYGNLCEHALEEGVNKVIKYCEMQLSCWRPHRSTSAFSNACNDEAYDAYRKFIEDFKVLFNS